MLGSTEIPDDRSPPYLLTLTGRGFYWFRLLREEAAS
jgi:hypothetical protein